MYAEDKRFFPDSLPPTLGAIDELWSSYSGHLGDTTFWGPRDRLRCHNASQRAAHEARQLAAMGFAVTEEIEHEIATAHKFYRYGMVLKQVANFYNTIEKQIVRSQKPLLLDYARSHGKPDKAERYWNLAQQLNPDSINFFRQNLTLSEEGSAGETFRKRRSEYEAQGKDYYRPLDLD